MSYCRWSTDDFQCDLYVYANVSGKWTIHVANNRATFLEELPAVDLMEDAAAWAERQQLVMDMLDDPARHERKAIGLGYDGETFDLDTPGEAADVVAMLRDLGYNVPSSVIEELRADQLEFEKSNAG